MNTTQTYLTRLKAKHGGASDYKAALILGISHQAVSRYKSGKGQMNEDVATKLASELGLDPVKMYAEVRTETAESPESRQFWGRILDMSKTMPALALLGLAVVLPVGNEVLSIL